MTPLPRDAALVELRADALTFRTRECLLPGAFVSFSLLLEGRPLQMTAPVEACLVMDRDRSGYVFHVRLALSAVGESDRQLVALFILKGRGSPVLAAGA